MGSKEPKKRDNGTFSTTRNPFLRPVDGQATREPLTTAPGLLSGIDMAVRAGCAVMIGGTRDGGAYCITVLDGDNRHRTYCHDKTELEDAARALMEMYV